MCATSLENYWWDVIDDSQKMKYENIHQSANVSAKIYTEVIAYSTGNTLS